MADLVKNLFTPQQTPAIGAMALALATANNVSVQLVANRSASYDSCATLLPFAVVSPIVTRGRMPHLKEQLSEGQHNEQDILVFAKLDLHRRRRASRAVVQIATNAAARCRFARRLFACRNPRRAASRPDRDYG